MNILRRRFFRIQVLNAKDVFRGGDLFVGDAVLLHAFDLVEQNAFHALRLADRAYVLVNGAVTMTGTGADLLTRPEIRAAYLEGGH